MAEVFLSYSHIDSHHATALERKLHAAGVSIWIDEKALRGAERWSREIAAAIQECTVVVLLVSKAALESKNVLRELTLASEMNKAIIPVEVAPVVLTHDFMLPLAGIHRVRFDDIESIMLSLAKLGVGETVAAGAVDEPRLEYIGHASSHPSHTSVKIDSRKSLMVLPFEDLSPEVDNSWFSDGLTGELISALSNIKSLRLIDRKTSMDVKAFRGKTRDIARELDVRYFLEGNVRKFGDQIKISVELLDIVEGEYLWQDFHKGIFADIFEIQEEVARKVVEGLRLTLTREAEQKVLDKGTENAEAYEMYLRAMEYANRHTRDGNHHALAVVGEAISLDASYAHAYRLKAYVLAELYRTYDRRPEYLVEAEALCGTALRLRPDLWRAYESLSAVYRVQGRLKEAEAAALAYVRNAPEPRSHFCLGFFYMETGRAREAIPCLEEALRLATDDLVSYWNIVVACERSGESERARRWSETALPYFIRHLRLVPDDETARVWYANLLWYVGNHQEAKDALLPLESKRDLDGSSLYNIACLQIRLVEYAKALKSLQRSYETNFSMEVLLKTDADLDPIRQEPEFIALSEVVASKISYREPGI